MPPAELYELGGCYFVMDGNHRVSVARYPGAAAVDALVEELVVDCERKVGDDVMEKALPDLNRERSSV